MSYTQYDQYGGNPYNNGPNAENGQGGVRFNFPLSTRHALLGTRFWTV